MWLCWRLLLLLLLGLLLLGVLLGLLLGGLLGRVRKLACRHGMRIVSVHVFGGRAVGVGWGGKVWEIVGERHKEKKKRTGRDR
jgi:hypothetical protein